MVVESLVKWNQTAEILSHMGYSLFLMQHGAKEPEGFLARFVLSGAPDVMVVTHDTAVADAIVMYGHGR